MKNEVIIPIRQIMEPTLDQIRLTIWLERCRGIKRVIFNDPATIVLWRDGSKTVVKCQADDEYDKRIGLAMAICKKFFGNKGNYNDVFKEWIPDEEEDEALDKQSLQGRRRGKKCIACRHYSYNANIPGMTHYEGDCDAGHVPCFGDRDEKIFGRCDDWQKRRRI